MKKILLTILFFTNIIFAQYDNTCVQQVSCGVTACAIDGSYASTGLPQPFDGCTLNESAVSGPGSLCSGSYFNYTFEGLRDSTSIVTCEDNETFNADTCVCELLVPLVCPANSLPDVNNTSCICTDPYINIGTVDAVVCALPDTNSTNSGSSTCRINTWECDSDCNCPAGTTQYTGSFTVPSTGELRLSTCNSQVFSSVYCFDSVPNNPDNLPECDYPRLSYFGYPFQGMTADIAVCNDIQNLYGGAGSKYPCPDGSVACYYYNSDNNSSAPVIPDTNSTSTSSDSNTSSLPDANSTIKIDTSTIERKIDVTNSHLADLGAVLTTTSNNNHTDLSLIRSSVDGLGSKLDGIQSSLLNNHIDMSLTNQKLDEIKNALNPDLDIDTSDSDLKLSELKIAFNDALVSFQTTGNDIRALSGGFSSPSVSASGDCSLRGSTGRLGNFTFDFSSVSNLRVPLQFFLNIFLLILTLRLYSKIARDLMSYFSGGW